MPLIKVSEVVKREFETIAEGKYEVFVDKYDTPETVNETDEQSRIMFRIRDDQETPHKSQCIFTNIRASWGWMINGISKALGIPTNTEYETLAEFLEDIKGKCLVVKVKHRTNPKDLSKPFVNVTDFFPTVLGEYTPTVEVSNEVEDIV
jgi:hypothetical protein